MKHKASSFLALLNSFVTEYLPGAVGASPNTIKSYKAAFRLLLKYLYQEKGIPADQISFEALNYQTMIDFLSWLEKSRGCSATTKNQRLSALASFSSYAQNRDFAAASTFRSSVTRIPMKKATHKNRAIFTREEVTILLRLPYDHYKIGLRDKVLLSLMYASGARAQEICDLTVKDIQFSEKGASLNITGKGRKKRRIGISYGCASLLKGYIDHRKIASLPERHIFSSQTHEKMTVSCIEEIFKKYVWIAKQKNFGLFIDNSYTPHSMRHSTASHMLEAGVPLAVIKNFLGHSSLQSTQIYAEISQNTVDKHLKEWNERWFPIPANAAHSTVRNNEMPDFLR
jgi:site-specific recombinase XerD